MSIASPLKWHGGKAYLASKIVSLFPPRRSAEHSDGYLNYVEPFAGGLSVLLANDPAGISEVVNDLNERLIEFWRVLSCAISFSSLVRRLETTPFSELEWETAFKEPNGGPVERAAKFFVLCRQSLAGRMKAFAPRSRSRTRGGMNEQVSAWLSAIDGLPEVHARLKRVLLLSQPALDVIRSEDSPSTLFYLDPPYLHSTRATTADYQHEMSEEGHRELLETLASIKGRFLLSGYPSTLYDDFKLKCNWRCHTFDLPNNAAGGAAKRRMTECVWTNYEVPSER